jgi:hypothetical protein
MSETIISPVEQNTTPPVEQTTTNASPPMQETPSSPLTSPPVMKDGNYYYIFQPPNPFGRLPISIKENFR